MSRRAAVGEPEASDQRRFTIVGFSSLFPEPRQHECASATEAEAQCRSLLRQGGRQGHVVIYGRNGGEISRERLERMARQELERA